MQPEAIATTGMKLESAGLHIARYSLVLVLVWIGAMKFTAYEAGAIQPNGGRIFRRPQARAGDRPCEC